jgi:hypothetical protein
MERWRIVTTTMFFRVGPTKIPCLEAQRGRTQRHISIRRTEPKNDIDCYLSDFFKTAQDKARAHCSTRFHEGGGIIFLASLVEDISSPHHAISCNVCASYSIMDVHFCGKNDVSWEAASVCIVSLFL